jgi:hypothetical protein
VTDHAAASGRTRAAAGGDVLIGALYGLGGLLLALEAAVHVQQFVVIFHGMRWIGPLFVANAAACVVALAGLVPKRTRPLAALAGIAISTAALGGLVLSYAVGCSAGWKPACARRSRSPSRPRSAQRSRWVRRSRPRARRGGRKTAERWGTTPGAVRFRPGRPFLSRGCHRVVAAPARGQVLTVGPAGPGRACTPASAREPRLGRQTD